MKQTNRNMKKTLTLTVMGISTLALVTGCHTSHHHYAYYSSPSPVIAAGGSETTSSEASTSATSQSATAGNETVIPLYEESVKTGTREVDAGTVTLRKKVTTETVNQPVQIRRETVSIERQPAGSSAQESSSSGEAFKNQDIVIHLKKEEPVFETTVTQTGKIVARKQMQSQQENVQRQIRKDQIEVVKEGNPENVTISKDVQSVEGQGGASSAGGQSTGKEGKEAQPPDQQ